MPDLKFYLDIQKTFKSEGEVPSFFKDLDLEKGDYFWAVATNNDVDRQGERVELSNEVAMELEKKGKIMMEHDKEGKNTGMASVGKIKFLRKVAEMENQFIVLSRLNEHHPLASNILGSIENGNLDAVSISGNAPPERVVNPETGKTETVRRVRELNEISLTSSPANEGAQVAGSFIVKNTATSRFYAPRAGYGGVEIYKNTESEKMEETNFASASDMTTLKTEVGELNKKMDGMESRITESFTQSLKKAMEEGSTEDKVEKTGEEDKEESSEEKKEDTDKSEDDKSEDDTEKKDAVDKEESTVDKLQKSMEVIRERMDQVQTTNRVGTSQTGRIDEAFVKNKEGELTIEQKTPFADLLYGGK